jgi:hypothetical protein
VGIWGEIKGGRERERCIREMKGEREREREMQKGSARERETDRWRERERERESERNRERETEREREKEILVSDLNTRESLVHSRDLGFLKSQNLRDNARFPFYRGYST